MAKKHNTINKVKRQLSNSETIFAAYTTLKALTSLMYKQFLKIVRQRTKNSTEKWENANNLHTHTKIDFKVALKHEKNVETHN